MKVVFTDITRENLDEIPKPCTDCLYWEFPEDSRNMKSASKKRDWFCETLREFGNCGKIVYYENAPVGYAQYAPATRLPNVKSYGSKLIGQLEDGIVFISCLYITGSYTL